MRRKSSPEVLAEMAEVSVQKRIELKLAYVQGLLDGKNHPPDTWSKFPRSLAKYAELHVPSMGLYRVGRTNDFTMTSRDFGTTVTSIQKCLDDINLKFPKKPPVQPSVRSADKVEASKRKELESEGQLHDVLAQMHIVEHDLDQERIASAGLRLQLSIAREALAQERLYGSRNAKTTLRLVK